MSSQGGIGNWSEVVKLDLPSQIDDLPPAGLPYDKDLLKSMDITHTSVAAPSSCKEVHDESSFSARGDSSEALGVPDPRERVKIFKARWGGLRKKCAEPKTSRMVVSTMRCEVLTCFRETGLLNTRELDLLDGEWDTLGVDRVCLFVNLFLEKESKIHFISSPGPYVYLTGMADSMRVTQNDLFLSFLESQANVSADLKLASKSIEIFRSSMQEAEGIWRDQSTLCSKYLSSLESQLKLIKIAADTPRPESSSHPAPKQQQKPSQDTHTPYIYKKSGDNYEVIYIGDMTKQVNKVIEQCLRA